MDCGPLADWLRKKCCIYATKTFDDNLCVWRCLAIHRRQVHGEENQVHKRNCKTTLNLARDYYGNNKLKRKDVRPTKLIDLRVLQSNTTSISYEPKWDSENDAGSNMAVSLW